MEHKGETLLWLKHKFWSKGIGPDEFNRTSMKDINDVIDIENAIQERNKRENEIQDTLRSMR